MACFILANQPSGYPLEIARNLFIEQYTSNNRDKYDGRSLHALAAMLHKTQENDKMIFDGLTDEAADIYDTMKPLINNLRTNGIKKNYLCGTQAIL